MDASENDDLPSTPLFAHSGVHYVHFMSGVMERFGVERYFEIGTHAGRSLAPVTATSVAVDPRFRIRFDIIGTKKACLLFQMTSDAFFKDYDLKSLLGSAFDVAFLDGLHRFEYVLRDFMNTERQARRNSVIFIHDCLPPRWDMAGRRAIRGKGWAGDVWKIVPILNKYRGDLKVELLDCRPTGLVAVTNLDPSSRVLELNYDDILSEFKEAPDDEEKIVSFARSVKVTETKAIVTAEDYAKFIWL